MDYSIITAQTPEIAIIGAGAVGSLFGGRLAGAGCNVSFITKNQEQADLINSNGVTVHEQSESFTYKRISAFSSLKGLSPDIVFIAVKTPDTKTALLQAAPFIPPLCTVITLQNGVNNAELISEYIPYKNIIAGVTYSASSSPGPGSVHVRRSGVTIIGEPDGTLSPRLVRIKNIFESTGLDIQISPNITQQLWEKLIINAALFPLSALTRLTNNELASSEWGYELMDNIGREAVALAASYGITLSIREPAKQIYDFAVKRGTSLTAMRQDIVLGRKTEIDSLNGFVAEQSGKHGLFAPYNKVMTKLVKLLELSYLTKE